MTLHGGLTCVFLALLVASSCQATTQKEKLDAVPYHYMDAVKEMVEGACWHVANIRFGGSKGEQNRHSFLSHEGFKKMALRAQGLDITEGSHNDMREIAWASAWGTSNLNDNRRSAAKRDQENINRAAARLKTRGDLTDGWVDTFVAYCWDQGWHAANSKEGDDDDAKNDKERADAKYKELGCEAVVTTVTFPQDSLEVVNEKLEQPVGHVIIVDARTSNSPQSSTVRRTVSKSKTQTVTKEVGFTFGYSRTVTAGVLFVEASMTFSFEMSAKQIWETSTTETEEDAYEWPVVAPARECVAAVAMVNQYDVEAPYTTTIKMKDVERKFNGVWKGLIFHGIKLKTLDSSKYCK